MNLNLGFSSKLKCFLAAVKTGVISGMAWVAILLVVLVVSVWFGGRTMNLVKLKAGKMLSAWFPE